MSQIQLNGVHTLIVEDDPMMSALAAQMLSRAGASTASARSATEALDAIAAREPDIILLDLNLPDLDGLDLLVVLREASSIPIVVVTGYLDPEFRQEAFEFGASGFLTKPISAQALLEAVHTALTVPYEELRKRFTSPEPEPSEPPAPQVVPVDMPESTESAYGRFINELDSHLQDADEFVRGFVQRGGE